LFKERRRILMKKNVLIKGILLLVVIAVFAFILVGCDGFTGTVYLIVGGYYWYDLYMDYVGKYWSVAPGTYVLYNVPIGNHFFEAIDIDGSSWGYDGVYQYINIGNNYVYLYP
jgi:hypothetical protein